MFVFPLAYLLSFFYACKELSVKKPVGVLFFIIVGLPLYITSLSVLHLYGLDFLVPLFQYAKEVILVAALAYLVYRLPALPVFNLLDKLVLFFFLFVSSYILLPLGSFGIFEKVVAFKNVCFFPVVYFIGRLLTIQEVWLSQLQKYIMFTSIAAALVLVVELLLDTHLQQFTGYASFYDKYFSFDPAGNYGLSWTFEIEGGVKRFASFFANPLELAASTLITAPVLMALFTVGAHRQDRKMFYLTLLGVLLSVVFALSRASFLAFVVVGYLFSLLTGRRKMLQIYYAAGILICFSLLFFTFNNSISDFIVATINFSDSSSLSHLLEWISGLEAIAAQPFGMGLGESGRVAGVLGLNVGGENQFIILGVQCGVIAMFLYLAIIILSSYMAARLFKVSTGRAQQVSLMVFLIRVGLFIPCLTAAVESYLYVSYIGWFFTGIMSSAWGSALHQLQPVASKSSDAE